MQDNSTEARREQPKRMNDTNDDQPPANPPLLPATGSADSWRVHILGPDDIIPMPDELEALRQCNMTNIVLANIKLKYANDPNYPWSMAVVERNGIEYTEPQHLPLNDKISQDADRKETNADGTRNSS